MRKRSKYKPRPIMRDPISYVIDGFKPMSEEGQTRTRLRQHSSMHALTHGSAEHDDWQVIRELLNVSAALSQTLFDKAYLEEIRAGMLAHAQCGKRWVKTGKYGYSGEELTTVNTAIAIYEEQLRMATMQEIGVALMMVEKAIRDKNFYTSVVEKEKKYEKADA